QAGDKFCGSCGAGVSPSAGVRSSSPDADIEYDDAADAGWGTILDRLRDATDGDYVVSHEIGSGGMAAVYLGFDVKLNRKVAMKVMSPSLLSTKGMVERFHDEAITVAQLSHP